MALKNRKQAARLKRKKRVRKNIFGVASKPRLTVFKSARHIYAQIIDDLRGHTLAAASTRSKEIRDKVVGLKKLEAAQAVGTLLAAQAKQMGISKVAFDRNGFLYHGRVKELADSCRKHGLEF